MTRKSGQTTKTDGTETEKTDLLSNYTKKKQETNALYEDAVANLTAGYTDAQKQLDTTRQNRMEAASVNLDLLQKYLPIQNRANGMTGLGVSETATLDAYNQYAAHLGNIEQSYAADRTALQQDYDAQKNTLEKERQTAQDALYDNYRNEVTAEQDMIYSEAMSRLKSADFTSDEEMEDYLASLQGDVSEAQYKQLSEKVENEKRKGTFRTPTLKTAGISYSESENDYNRSLKTGEKFKVVRSDGSPLWVESRGQEGNTLVKDAAKDLSNGTVFLYDGKIYLRQNGNIYRLGGTGDNDNTGHYRTLYRTLQEGE